MTSWIVLTVAFCSLVTVLRVVPVVQHTAYRVMKWGQDPSTNHLDPWRTGLLIVVLLMPLISTLFTSIQLYFNYHLTTPFSGPTSFAIRTVSVWYYINFVGESLVGASWLGLIAYGVLRRPHLGAIRFIGCICCYWLGAYSILSLLLSGSRKERYSDINSLVVTGFYLLLIVGLFELASKAVRARLIAGSESNNSIGLRIRDILVIVFGFGLVLSGIQMMHWITDQKVLIWWDTPLGSFAQISLNAIMATLAMSINLLTRTQLHKTIGIGLLLFFQACYFFVDGICMTVRENDDWFGGGRGITLFAHGLFSNFIILAAMFGLKSVWQQIGLTICIGTKSVNQNS